MLFIIASFGKKSSHSFEPLFDGRCSFELCMNSFSKVAGDAKKIAVFCDDFSLNDVKMSLNKNPAYSDVTLVEKPFSYWTASALCDEISLLCEKLNEEDALLGYGDKPFYNISLINELIENHCEYKAEYSFSDGYINGISPVIVNKGASKIIAELGKDSGPQATAGSRLVSEVVETEGSCPIFSILQGDINSFEIETVIAKDDYRLLRCDLSVSKKMNRIACENAFKIAKNLISENELYSADDFCRLLSDKISILKTVPAFYNIQISDKDQNMSLSNFKTIVKKAADFSNEAVFSLSAYFDLTKTDAFANPDFPEFAKIVLENENFSLFIETDGKGITESLCSEISDFIKNLDFVKNDEKKSENRIFFAVEFAPGEEFVEKIALIEKCFPGSVYPQLTRTQKTEENLETFYRYWSKKDNESKGNVIIQKFNNYCGAITELHKTADLAPVKRNPCWHLRRDMTILCDGTVPMCMQCGILNRDSEKKSGNIFTDDISEIWKKMDAEAENHIKNNYCKLCKDCDEYYTFNF